MFLVYVIGTYLGSPFELTSPSSDSETNLCDIYPRRNYEYLATKSCIAHLPTFECSFMKMGENGDRCSDFDGLALAKLLKSKHIFNYN